MGILFLKELYGDDADGNRGRMELFYELSSDVSHKDLAYDDAVLCKNKIMSKEELVNTLELYNVKELLDSDNSKTLSFNTISEKTYYVLKANDDEYFVCVKDSDGFLETFNLDDLDLKVFHDYKREENVIVDMTTDDLDELLDMAHEDFEDYYNEKKDEFENPELYYDDYE